jgi:transcriptional regulator NrdR family protein
MIKHFVFIKYKTGTDEKHIEQFCQKIRALSDEINEIEALEVGRDILREARSWDVLLSIQFASIAALRVYQQHPAHQAVMKFNDPFVAEIGAVDF